MELYHVFKGNQQIFNSKEMKRGKISVVALICLKFFYSFAYDADVGTQQNQPKVWNKRTKWVFSQGLFTNQKGQYGQIKIPAQYKLQSKAYIQYKKINETVNINKIEMVFFSP